MALRTFVSFEVSSPKDGQPPGRSRPRLLGGIKGEQLEQGVRAWCEALHATLTKEPGIRSVRWYDRETFDRDHGETWFDAPSG